MGVKTLKEKESDTGKSREESKPEENVWGMPDLFAALQRKDDDDSTTNANAVVDDLWASGAMEPTKDGVDLGDEEVEALSPTIFAAIAVIAVAGFAAVLSSLTSMDLSEMIANPTQVVETVVSMVDQMGTGGVLYFGLFYIVAEILAIPAVPIMTASSGYLFGTLQGTGICLVSASIAASVSFVIGRTFLRSYVERALAKNPKFKKIDGAIGREGFKLMLLLRLSPVFPFALSNYLYGASSIRFWPYFFGTLFGFAPGTFAYVYAGRIGKALTLDSATAEPWYVYVGGFAIIVALLRVVSDVATGVIDAIEDEEVEE